MPAPIAFHAATRHSLQQLAAFFNAAYEGYSYPVNVDAVQLARRVREEAIDLDVSAVLEVGGQPAGLFLVARRSGDAWCGGFGLNKPQRGRGLSAPLAAEMLARTRAAGADFLQLEVLQHNDAARATYEKAGLKVTRDLLILAWSATAGATAVRPVELRRVAISRHLDRLPAPGQPRAAWQRSLASLHARSEIEACETADGGAGVLLARMPDGNVRLLSFHGRDPAQLAGAIRTLQAAFRRIMVVNEPPDSPHLEALLSAGFVEIDRQYEMRVDFPAPRPPSA